MSLERRKKTEFVCNSAGVGLLLLITLAIFPAISASISSARVIFASSYSTIYSADLSGIEKTHTPSIVIDNQKISDNDPWLRAQIAVKNRYRQHDISTIVKSYNQVESFDLLLQVWQLINYYYYNNIPPSELINNAMIELQAVTSNPEIRQKYNISSQQAELLKKYILQQSFAYQNAKHIDYQQIKMTLENISNYCRDTDLESSWPIIETVFALCGNLDRYSDYIMPDKYNMMLESLKGNYKGIGTDLIFSKDRYPLVFDVLPESPAAQAGIIPGDLLIVLNNTDLKNISDQDFDSIFYCANQTTSLSIRRKEQLLDFNLKKTQLHSSTIRNTGILPGTRSGYFRITSFDKNTASQINEQMNIFADAIDNIIIDLRNNGGGMVTSAVEVADLFLKEGKIVSIKSFADTKTYTACADNKKTEQISIFILVNKNTASAAEIFTAALKQNNRAIVIGEKTFGKALVQTVYDLRHNAGAVMLTTAEYLPPSQKSFNLKGITPDIEVIDTDNQDFIDKNQCITERMSASNPVMQIALRCITN